MTLSKKRKNGRNGGGGDPHRRRLSAEQFAARDRRIWQMRADGHGFQDIADAEGCGLATVDRSLKRLLTSPWEEAFGEELDAALARYNDGSMACEDVCTAEDVFKLNDLQLFRLGHLPEGHPGPAARRELYAAGWRVVPSAERADKWTVEWRRIAGDRPA